MARDNYYQTKGRPHEGLKNPGKYGLTFSEVLDLIERGKWKTFKESWKRKRKRLLTIENEFLYVCPKCNEHVPNIKNWATTRLMCKGCAKQNREVKPKCRACRRMAKLNSLDLCNRCTTLLKELNECTTDLKDSILKLRESTRTLQPK